ncbi:RNA polymerase sigma factor [Flavobacterium rhizosphaerae]|uniref:RNA polymerase sigma factor n=1 Tax=Flavobacterium rhizosphaerae TaxID=3163298 RepID=A0ABW8YYV1_9FLAO
MKIIKLHTTDEALVKKALRKDAKAEKMLYDRYAAKMLGVCRLYIKDMHYAEDVMVQGFTKALDSLGKFRFEGSFEGWLRRIMVREAIDFLRGRRQIQFSEAEFTETAPVMVNEPDLDVDLLQLLIDKLPEGYRTVLVMYAIEGYNHKEIANTLNITENTSKSQLFKARKRLQEQLAVLQNKRV